ncbi:amidase [Kwoniella heveanensis BCC8398]|uniref:amidase n=1 Tax=Kwoniella heveanensis BCC8398 TaxID=1296120 RepID=A0A1B9H322_9TREE|nr:amidase [Kwoniella heveanensis BCC8398]
MVSHTESIALRKRAERETLVKEMEEELGLSSEHSEDEQYLSSSPEQIVQNLKARREGWTVERVTSAFIRSACAAQRRTNCLTEIVLFREALAEARRLDKEFAASGKAEGEFWGLPSSFKDTYNIIGVDSSLGCSPHCYNPTEKPEDEATMVKLYRKAGGIPFCKTNIPQTLLAFECRNPIFEATSNPYASDRTCGGSSGGEAALIALKGTPLGWGSDIGGSLRIPASYSGICGLKPVRGRWPVLGQRSSTRGFEGIKGVVGPMGRTVADLTFASKAMLNLVHTTDVGLRGEMLSPLPWQEVEIPRKLKVGYWTQDHLIKTSPACVRAVEECVAKLKAAGHEVVYFDPPDVAECMKVFAGLTSAEGYKTLLSNIGNDPMESSMRLVTLGSKIPHWLHWVVRWVVDNVLKDHLFASIFATSRGKSVKEVWNLTERRDDYANKFREAVWEQHKFDMLLCPVQAVPALQHGATKLLSPLSVGTILFNVVDSTVGVLPVTRVDRALDKHPTDYLEGSQGSWLLEKRIYMGEGCAYDTEKMHGLPVGVQVVGKAWEEEKVLGMMAVLEKLVGYQG